MQRITVTWKTLLLALLLSGTLPGTAQAATFGNYVYAVPAGWTQAKQGGSLVLTPPGLAPGERVTVRLTPGAASGTVAQVDLNTWFTAQMGGYNAGAKLVTQTPVQAQTSDDGQQLLASVAVVQVGGQTEWRFFIAAHPGNRAEMLVITTSSYEVFTARQDELRAFSDRLDFANARSGPIGSPASSPAAAKGSAQTGLRTQAGSGRATILPAAAPPTTTPPPVIAPPAGTPATTGTLPAVPVPNLAQLVAAGLDPEKQPIPDEFRCYLSHDSADYSRPAFALQILPGNHYRAPGGEGSYRMVQTSGGSLNYLRWQGGPLAGTDDAFLLFDRRSGQTIQLDGVGKDELRLYCHQCGASENHALVQFRRADPQVGAYPCRSTDGKNTDLGTLELLSGRTYRYRGGAGRYTVNILGKQGDSFSGVDFVGGPLDDTYSPYSEDELGERRFSGLPSRNARCAVVAKPIVEPKFGPGKAPAPPAGAGGLEGAYSYYIQNFSPSAGLNHYFYVFKKNGYVYTGDPDTSLADADCTRTLPSGLPLCEVYRLGNGAITIGTDKPVKWAKTAAGYVLDGSALSPLKPLGDLKLAGQYRSVTSFTAMVGTGGGLFEDLLTFRKDGTFSRQRSGGVSLTTTSDGSSSGDITGGVYSSTDRRNAGSYSLSGNTLTLMYGDGRTERLFAFLPGNEPALNWLYLGGGNYFLEKPGQK